MEWGKRHRGGARDAGQDAFEKTKGFHGVDGELPSFMPADNSAREIALLMLWPLQAIEYFINKRMNELNGFKVKQSRF